MQNIKKSRKKTKRWSANVKKWKNALKEKFLVWILPEGIKKKRRRKFLIEYLRILNGRPAIFKFNKEHSAVQIDTPEGDNICIISTDNLGIHGHVYTLPQEFLREEYLGIIKAALNKPETRYNSIIPLPQIYTNNKNKTEDFSDSSDNNTNDLLH